MIKFNNVELVVYPISFSVTTLDLDDGDSTTRTADGTLHRDRVAVKKQIDMEWGLLSWAQASAILQAMKDVFFDIYYPDPMAGTHVTKKFYAGNRPAMVAVTKGNDIYWSGLKVTLTER